MAQHLHGILVGIQYGAADHGRSDRVQPIAERSNDSEVSSAAAQCPEEIWIVRGARAHYSSIRHYDLGGEEIVAGRAIKAHQPAVAAAECQAGNADFGIGPSKVQ